MFKLVFLIILGLRGAMSFALGKYKSAINNVSAEIDLFKFDSLHFQL